MRVSSKNLLLTSQIKEADQITIERQHIGSIVLMERAAEEFVAYFVNVFKSKQKISIFCGSGNNGGDGLAIARLLFEKGFQFVRVYQVNFSEGKSPDCETNLRKLKKLPIPLIALNKVDDFKDDDSEIIIDAIFGVGLNRPLEGAFNLLVNKINALGKFVIAVDVPTGFPSEGVIAEDYNGIVADLVISFELPKLNFFFPESLVAIKRFKIISIGLDAAFISSSKTIWKVISEVQFPKRERFSHKGSFGHSLILAGSVNTMGAALLSGLACIRSGAGLTTLAIPKKGISALNSFLPEAMAIPREDGIGSLSKFTAIAIGPGLGDTEESESLVEQILSAKVPVVFDADAISILARNKTWYSKLKPGSILTPHVKEFDRLFGQHKSWWNRVETASQEACSKKIVIILKNQYTFVCLPNGEIHINTTGNPAMSSGGMGDVLTGIIVGLLAQSFTVEEASLAAVYIHGLTGDELAQHQYTVRAKEVGDYLPQTLLKLQEFSPI